MKAKLGFIKIEVAGPKDTIQQLKDTQKQLESAVKRSVSDMRSRAPGAISSCVTGVYNIKKSEVNPNSTKAGKKVVSMKITGETVESLTFTYMGRPLTATHFGMTPKVPPAGKSYTIMATIKKSEGKKVIGEFKKTTPQRGGPYAQQSPVMLLKSKNKQTGGTDFLPFQRNMEGHRPQDGLEAFTSISVPQMVEGKEVQPAIAQKLNELLGGRFEYHMSKIK